ncbi:MAG: hypothetical protein Q7S53_04605 [bacterium]|nr:hypothetical protein [bacterium]
MQEENGGKPADSSLETLSTLKESLQDAIREGDLKRAKEIKEQIEPVLDGMRLEINKPNPENVKKIVDWLDSKRGWCSGKKLSEHTVDAPDVSEADLRAMFLEMKPLGVADADYDTRGYYITALADKILEDRFSKWNEANPYASKDKIDEWWQKNGKIELTHPDTGRFASNRFRKIGNDWEKGTLILNGDFGNSLGSHMRGGQIVLSGNAGPSAGALMGGGKLEINGTAGYELGFGMSGGHIKADVSAPHPGNKMSGGIIEIGKVDTKLRGSNNQEVDKPFIGDRKTGGKIIVQGEEY